MGPRGHETDRLWALVWGHRHRLLRIARAYRLSPEDAEDCVHEAMVRCMEFGKLDRARVGSFLTSVTMRLCVDRYRARQYADQLHRRLAAERTHMPGPEETVVEREEARWLAAFVERLPPRQQEIVRAKAAGMSIREIATLTRMSCRAVESQLARARTAVRALARAGLALLPWLFGRTRPATTVTASAASFAVICVCVQGTPPFEPPGGGRPRVAAPVAGGVPAAVPRQDREPRTWQRQEGSSRSTLPAGLLRGADPPAGEDPKDRPPLTQRPILSLSDAPEDNESIEHAGNCLTYGYYAGDRFRCRDRAAGQPADVPLP